jgi:hypothetical protein
MKRTNEEAGERQKERHDQRREVAIRRPASNSAIVVVAISQIGSVER